MNDSRKICVVSVAVLFILLIASWVVWRCYYSNKYLMGAIKNKENYLAEMYIYLGADVNCVVENVTPLMGAVASGNKDMVAMLCNNGAKLNMRTIKDGYTAMHIAVIFKKIEMIDILCAKGGDLNIVDNYGRAALHYAIMQKNESLIRTLLKKGANVNTSGILVKFTPLQTAILSDDTNLVQLLLQSGADINLPTGGAKRAALDVARLKNNVKMIKFLKQHGAEEKEDVQKAPE